MSKILLISDNEVLNSIYSVNLKIYTNCELIVVDSLSDAVELFEQDSTSFSMVLSLCMIGDEDTALLAYHHLVENEVEVPFAVVGKQSEVPAEIPVIGNIFDIKGILKVVANKLEISAKEMASIDTPEFYAMPIRMFFPLESIPCDTYYQIIEPDGQYRYEQIFKANEPVWPRVNTYLDEGVSVLFVHASQRFSFAKHVTVQLIDDLNGIKNEPTTDLGRNLEVVEQGIETIAEQFFEGEVSKEVIELSNTCMNTMEEVIEEVPDLKSLLKELSAIKSGFLYSHSIIAGYVATHILDNIEWGGQSHKDKLKFVLFFHDMYLASVYKNHPELMYEDKLIFDDNLTEEEKEIVVSHADEAANAIRRYPKCPLGVDVIIRQHHGTTNGQGFATSYKDDISPLAKVLIISEAFTEQMLQTMHAGQKVEISKILESLQETFPKHTYVKLVKSLVNIKL